ncbi:MAG: hypothetical protein ACTSW1_16530 [Candidatus Hodarchaeales archaeon]
MEGLIKENENWRVRKRGDDFAVTSRKGRFTFYLHGSIEKVIFVRGLKAAYQHSQLTGREFYFFLLNAFFGMWLSVEDIKFLLDAFPLSESEKQLAIEEETLSQGTASLH